MRTQIKKTNRKLFIEIPKSVENMYQLKTTLELSMNVVEKNNSLIINCVLSDKDFN